MPVTKRRKEMDKLVKPGTKYPMREAIELVKKGATAKFNETMDLAVHLGVDPKQSDQQVRGTVVLPKGSGAKKRVLVFAMGENEKAAQAAGADVVGGDDLVDKVSKGWLDFDVAIATPDMMRSVGRLGKVLGPRGLMPNPKTGTVTFDIAKAVAEVKAGKVEYKVNAEGVLHTPFGKAKFAAEDLEENLKAVMGAIMKSKPPTSKGQFLKSVAISSTMGIGVKLDLNQFGAATAEK